MRALIPFSVAVVVVAVMIWQPLTPETVLMPEPEVVLPDVEGMSRRVIEMSETERNVLPADTLMVRNLYSDGRGGDFIVSAVIGGRSKNSVHRPELCLPGQGFRMTDPRTIRVGGTSWRRLTLERGNAGRAGFAYTFANGTGLRTSSHFVRILTDVWDRSVLGRIDRWVMLTVCSSRADDAELSRFLERLEGVVK